MRAEDRTLVLLSSAAFVLVLVGPVFLILDACRDALPHLKGAFFVEYASRVPSRAGIRAPLFGTVWLLVLTALLSVPLALGTALWLEESTPRRRTARWLQGAIRAFSGFPSIVFGVLGFVVFAQEMKLGRSLAAGVLTLTLFVAPALVMELQRAFASVPPGVREQARLLGAGPWERVRRVVWPLAWRRATAAVLRVFGRAAGAAAPLVLLGVLTFLAFTPETLGDPFTVLPLQVFAWATRPQDEFRGLAAAAVLVLMAISLGLQALALWVEGGEGPGGADKARGRSGGKERPGELPEGRRWGE